MNKRRLLTLLFLALPSFACALGPHEVLVLVNDRSSNSVDIAREFVRLRHVPEINVVRMNVPLTVEISPDDFATRIWAPALKAIRERGIRDHILAWVYSVDFPTTVATTPRMSIQGITFLRNTTVPAEQVDKGTYASILFAGPTPDTPGGEVYASHTFDAAAELFQDDMPLPSMMLGYVGERGNSKETVLKCLQRGAASDGTAPTGTVFLLTNDDIRAKCRRWQFTGVCRELAALGVQAKTTDTFPAGQDIVGLMAGAAYVEPGKENRYLPGSMAEHLTSFAGVFQNPDQTKMSTWIEAGAAGSAGTVVEPLAAWPKFPGARFFVHYANGCTLMESFFQSIRCPLQILLLGDPLAAPWAPTNATLRVEGLNVANVKGVLQLRAEVRSEPGKGYRRFLYLFDGKTVGQKQELNFDTSGIKEGPHTVRVVAYGTGAVRNQLFVERTVMVGKGP